MDQERAELVERVALLPDGNAWPSTIELLCDLRDQVIADAQTIAALRAEVERLRGENASLFMVGKQMRDLAMTDQPIPAEWIEIVAKALARNYGLNFDEVCGVDANPDEGYCDSSTCVASGYEDHDPAWARKVFRSQAEAAIRAIAPLIEKGEHHG